MVVEDILFNYGVLGIWTIVNLITIKNQNLNRDKREDNLTAVIANNTAALNLVNDKINICHTKNFR